MKRLLNLLSAAPNYGAAQSQLSVSALGANRNRKFNFRTISALFIGLLAFGFQAAAQDTNTGKEMSSATTGAILVDDATGAPLIPTGLHMNTFCTPDGTRLLLQVRNPDRERLTVRLINEKGHTLYSHFTNAKEHAYRFRLEEMPLGNYTVQVLGETKRISRDIAFDFKPGTYQVSMKPANTENPIALRQKKP